MTGILVLCRPDINDLVRKHYKFSSDVQFFSNEKDVIAFFKKNKPSCVFVDIKGFKKGVNKIKKEKSAETTIISMSSRAYGKYKKGKKKNEK